jgi:hypothetical protein
MRKSALQGAKAQQSEREIKAEVKRLCGIRDQLFGEISKRKQDINQIEFKLWETHTQIREQKEGLGHRKGLGCPALVKSKTKYGGEMIRCAARRFKYYCWSKDRMYERHCYYCHLTHDQAKTAAIFQRIDKGKIQSEEET